MVIESAGGAAIVCREGRSGATRGAGGASDRRFAEYAKTNTEPRGVEAGLVAGVSCGDQPGSG